MGLEKNITVGRRNYSYFKIGRIIDDEDAKTLQIFLGAWEDKASRDRRDPPDFSFPLEWGINKRFPDYPLDKSDLKPIRAQIYEAIKNYPFDQAVEGHPVFQHLTILAGGFTNVPPAGEID